MNNFKTDITGGLPFRLDDLRFINAANMEAIVGIIQSLIGDTTAVILNGCEVSVNPDHTEYHINQGYIYFSNEIFYAPAQDIPYITSGVYVWEIDVSYDPAGDKTFDIDGVVHSTYEIRTAKLVFYMTDDGKSPEMKTINIVDVLKSRLGLDLDPTWTTIALDSNNVSIASSGSISQITGNFSYKVIGKTLFAQIYLNLSVDVSNTGSLTLNILFPPEIDPKGPSLIISSLIYDNDPAATDARMFRLFTTSHAGNISIEEISKQAFAVRTYQLQGEIFFEIN